MHRDTNTLFSSIKKNNRVVIKIVLFERRAIFMLRYVLSCQILCYTISRIILGVYIMFCIFDTKYKKNYLIGDEMFVCLVASRSFKFKCTLKDVLDNGQVILGDIKVYSKTDKYVPMDGTIKTGVYEILAVNMQEKYSKKYSALSLLYKDKTENTLPLKEN